MASIPFNESELKIVDTSPVYTPGAAATPIFDYPVSRREGVRALYERKPIWELMTDTGHEICTWMPRIIPDNIARCMVFDGQAILGETFATGGKDMFGIDWVYVPVAGGSMVEPGNPFAEDAEELLEKVVWPDPDQWDWEWEQENSKSYLETDQFIMNMFLNGYFERLISMLDFENALMALFDEDEQECVNEFFTKLTDLYINIFDHMHHYFPQIDGVCFHDDWGSQKDTFFSPEIANEMIVPHMRRLNDFMHSNGIFMDLHSCGNNLKQVPNYIEAGWDSWAPQAMNDTKKIYDLYGDKLLIGVMPEYFDPATTSVDEQQRMAREFVDYFCNPDKPCALNMYSSETGMYTEDYWKELYKQSRIKFAK